MANRESLYTWVLDIFLDVRLLPSDNTSRFEPLSIRVILLILRDAVYIHARI